jgi:hypothetical protein
MMYSLYACSSDGLVYDRVDWSRDGWIGLGMGGLVYGRVDWSRDGWIGLGTGGLVYGQVDCFILFNIMLVYGFIVVLCICI